MECNENVMGYKIDNAVQADTRPPALHTLLVKTGITVAQRKKNNSVDAYVRLTKACYVLLMSCQN